MPVKIRLQRHGRKGKPFFHIVVADSRARRDGRKIEKLGVYNPTTNPATIELDVDKSVDWLIKGAQPTNTARAILSYKGVLYKKHLLGGVAKGAFDEAEAEKRFANWLEEKADKIDAKIKGLSDSAEKDKKARLEAEKKVSDARLAVEEVAEETTEAVQEAAETMAETTEVTAEETKEEVAEEVKEVEDVTEVTEAPAEEKAEEKEGEA